jgi:hypothetical protein
VQRTAGCQFVILFSSYGSPGAIAHEPNGSSPFWLATSQHLLAPDNQHASLYFTRNEYDDAVTRFSMLSSKSNADKLFVLQPGLHEFLVEFTSGHPAAVHFVLDVLFESSVSCCSSFLPARSYTPSFLYTSTWR